jgi:hypothetical protein
MMMISLHSSGQPRMKMISCATQQELHRREVHAQHEVLDHVLAAQIREHRGEGGRPTNRKHTMAEVRAVRYTDSRSRSQVKAR